MSDLDFRARARAIIQDTTSPAGRVFDWVIQGLIVYSLVSLTIETLPDWSLAARRFFQASEVVVVGAFSVEYLLRLWAAEKRWGFVFSLWGLIDLLAVLPFYVASGIDLRGVRIIRLFRVLRLLKMARYNSAIKRLTRAVRSQREEFLIFLGACAALIYLAAVGIYYFERAAQPEVFVSIPHALWWSVSTLTTVGYGDAFPVTAGGKIFTSIIILIGMGIIAVPAGLLASALTNDDSPD